MSLTVFLALCILGLDFMIYVFFKLTLSDRRSVIARRVAAHRAAVRAESAGLFIVPAKQSTIRQEPDHSPSLSGSNTNASHLFPPDSYRTRIA